MDQYVMKYKPTREKNKYKKTYLDVNDEYSELGHRF